jgi:hypothetical protein
MPGLGAPWGNCCARGRDDQSSRLLVPSVRSATSRGTRPAPVVGAIERTAHGHTPTSAARSAFCTSENGSAATERLACSNGSSQLPKRQSPFRAALSGGTGTIELPRACPTLGDWRASGGGGSEGNWSQFTTRAGRLGAITHCRAEVGAGASCGSLQPIEKSLFGRATDPPRKRRPMADELPHKELDGL